MPIIDGDEIPTHWTLRLKGPSSQASSSPRSP